MLARPTTATCKMPGACDVNAETVAQNMGFCVEYAITCPRDPQKLYRKDQAHAASKNCGSCSGVLTRKI